MTSTEKADIVIIGAGAAGLMAAIFSARAQSGHRVLMLDGARKLGAKILVSGGGRCNVTHDAVSEVAYAGSSRNAVRKVLRRFDVPATVQFFQEIGVDLKRESTGKLFPVDDSARTVLNALLDAARQAGAIIQHPKRVETLERDEASFRIGGSWGTAEATRVILATGGKSLPKTGSDGFGYILAERMGHTLTKSIYPALVPLTLPPAHFICQLSGVTTMATLEVRTRTGKRLAAFTDSTLCTHFGLSGPSALDISRYYLAAAAEQEGAALVVNWLPNVTPEAFDEGLRTLGRGTVLRLLTAHLPERLARALCAEADVPPGTPGDQLTREARRRLMRVATQLMLPVTGSRGFNFAEVTAGGVPLDQMYLDTMESRITPGLHFCGEICDVDGQIGGYNFQWAWSSGYVAGTAAARMLV